MNITLEDRKRLGESVLKVFATFSDSYNKNENKKTISNALDEENGFEKVVNAVCNVLLYEVEHRWLWDETEKDFEEHGKTSDIDVNGYKSLRLFREVLDIISEACKRNEERLLNEIKEE